MSSPAVEPFFDPSTDLETAPFWDRLVEGELRVQRCLACGTCRFPPGVLCRACGGEAHEWIEPTGPRLVSWIVVHRSSVPDVTVPYVVGMVEFDQDVRMLGELVLDTEPAVGAALRVEIVQRPHGARLRFVAATGG